MKRTLILTLGTAALLWVATPAHAQTSSKRATPRPTTTEPSPSTSPRTFDQLSTRIHLGERAPDFELDSSAGRAMRLASLRGDWVALVFGDRCAPMSSYAGIERELRLVGARLVAVCREKPGVVAAAVRRDQLPFLMFADATGEVSTLYGLRSGVDPETAPALFVLDRRGIVRRSVVGQEVGPADVVSLVKTTQSELTAERRR
jgi:peroxiredoxin